MSLGSNGLDQVRSLRKILKQLRLVNVCINSTCSAIFCINIHIVMKLSETRQNMSFSSNGVDHVRLLQKIQTRLRLAN
jgi:hypothetical protein